MLVCYKRNTLYLVALGLFMLSAIYGLLIRLNFVFPIDSFVYRNFLQSHSHVAFLGWGYLAVVGAIKYCFISEKENQKNIYKITLWIILVTVFLMLFSFPLVGYKLFSIVLLCLFGVTSYVLSYHLLKDIKGNKTSVKLIRYGVYYYLLSSLATWFLAWVLISQGKTNLYYNTVYFYLHFLYNGFFVFVLFGLLFKIIENQQIVISESLQKNFFIYLNIACVPAYALSILWSKVLVFYHILGFFAAVLQFISLIFLIKIISTVYKQLKWNAISNLLLKFGLIAYSLKVLIQVVSPFPYFVEKSLALKPFLIIGYLHLFTLAFMSVFIFLILNQLNKIHFKSLTARVGGYSFLTGVLFTELILFLQGLLMLLNLSIIKNYQNFLLLFSGVIVLGIVLIFIDQFNKNYSNKV